MRSATGAAALAAVAAGGGAAALYWGIALAASGPGRRVFERSLVWRGAGDRPVVALTFDDGPHPRYTEAFARALDGERATFFALGASARRWPSVLREVASAGHEVACHGDTHRRMTRLSPRETAEELRRGRGAITKAAGAEPRFFRPPHGLFNLAAWVWAPRLGMRRTLWTASARDWEATATPDSITGRVLDAAVPGAILLLHDAGGWEDRPARTLEALPGIVHGLRDRGLGLVTLTELVA